MEYINSFKDSIKETFESMFDEIIILENETTAPTWILSKGAAVVVGITGEKKGKVLLDMSLETALELAKKVDSDLGEEDLALFTMAEFCNISSGGAITMMNDSSKRAGLRLATPSIFTGINAKIFSPNMKAILFSYNSRFGLIDFHIGFEGV